MLRYAAAPFWRSAHRALGYLRPPTSAFRILLFHDVPPDQAPAFSRLLHHIYDHHGIISPDDAECWLRGGNQGKCSRVGHRPCLISFDDGFRSNYEVARSILGPLGIKALFFIAPGLTELPEERQPQAIASQIFRGAIHADDLPSHQRLMTWQQLAKLRDDGHVIGCHGLSHNRLRGLAPDKLKAEIAEARNIMNHRLGGETPWYAFAFGDISSIDRQALGIIGRNFSLCRSGIRGENHAHLSPLALHADSISLSTPFSYQKLLAEGGIDSFYGTPRRQLLEMAANLDGH